MTTDNRDRQPLIVRHNRVIFLLAIVLCIGGVYSAIHMPAAVFPQTDFPRVVVLIDNGEMPADEMMATITRPVEEMVKDIPGVIDIRSATGRGSAEVNVFFDGDTDMVTAELYVLNRVATADLPPTSSAHVERLTFSSFPILGISLVSDTRTLDELWQMAEYEIKPRLLRIPGVARIKLVGGDVPGIPRGGRSSEAGGASSDVVAGGRGGRGKQHLHARRNARGRPPTISERH